MIFKTFNSDIDKWTAKIGIFGKSFNELGTAVNNALKATIDNIDNFNENVGFWESLKNNLFYKNDSDKDWIKNSLKEIISQENIDSYIAELKPDKAREKLKDIFDWKNIIDDNNNNKTWQDYFDTLKDGSEKYIPDLIKNTDDLSKLERQDLVNACNEAREAAIAHNAALKQQTLGAKAAAVGMQALATAGNMLLSFGISLAISSLISGLDYLIHKEEKEMEALGEAQDKFSQTTDEIKSLNDELASTQDRIKELQALADNGTISVADENELKILKETNEELQRKIALKQKEQADDAEDLLEKAQKVNKDKPYSYIHYNDEGNYITEYKHGNATERLQDTIKQYQDAVKHYGKDKVNAGNYNDAISEQAESVGNLIEAYHSLKDAGMQLTKEQQDEYNSALKAQDVYLLYSYNLSQTKERFQALNEEQQRSILNDKLLGQGLTEQEIKVVLKYIPEENLDDYYDFSFDFPLPDHKDYKTVEEYGKAYAEAWKNGRGNLEKDGNNVVNEAKQKLEELQNSYKSVSEDISSLTTALSESVSGTGL